MPANKDLLETTIEAAETASVLKACIQARVALERLRHAPCPVPDAAIRSVAAGCRFLNGLPTYDDADVTPTNPVVMALSFKPEHVIGRKLSGSHYRSLLSKIVPDLPAEGRKAQNLEAKLTKLVFWMNEGCDAMDPLIAILIAHKYFCEAAVVDEDLEIECSMAILEMHLVAKSLIERPGLNLAMVLGQKRNAYHEVLQGDSLEKYLVFMLNAVSHAATASICRFESFAEMHKRVAQIFESNRLLAKMPECREICQTEAQITIGLMVGKNIAARQTAAKYFDILANLPHLESARHGRQKILVNRVLAQIVSDTDDEPGKMAVRRCFDR